MSGRKALIVTTGFATFGRTLAALKLENFLKWLGNPNVKLYSTYPPLIPLRDFYKSAVTTERAALLSSVGHVESKLKEILLWLRSIEEGVAIFDETCQSTQIRRIIRNACQEQNVPVLFFEITWPSSEWSNVIPVVDSYFEYDEERVRRDAVLKAIQQVHRREVELYVRISESELLPHVSLLYRSLSSYERVSQKSDADVLLLIEQFVSCLHLNRTPIVLLQNTAVTNGNGSMTEHDRNMATAVGLAMSDSPLHIFCSTEASSIEMMKEVKRYSGRVVTTDRRNQGVTLTKALDHVLMGPRLTGLSFRDIKAQYLENTEALRLAKSLGLNTDSKSRHVNHEIILASRDQGNPDFSFRHVLEEPEPDSDRKTRLANALLDLEGTQESRLVITSPDNVKLLLDYFRPKGMESVVIDRPIRLFSERQNVYLATEIS
ncbi:MAG: 6-phosphofructo-2-kinase domain-containing protein [Candidatus Komeilibacteria bacterium]